MRLRQRSRTGSPRAANAAARSTASRSPRGAERSDGTQQSSSSVAIGLRTAVFAITPPIDTCRWMSHHESIDGCESIRRPVVSRVQLALNVDDLDTAVDFY